MKMFDFLKRFHWSLFPEIGPIDNKPAFFLDNKQQVIIWTNDGLICWCINVSLSLNALVFAC